MENSNNKQDFKISAVVHTYNDARHLEECLTSIRWCDEVLVVDLGSHDQSITIASRIADRVLQHEWVPIVEMVRQWSYEQAAHDWILCVDPDEVFPSIDMQFIIRSKLKECEDSIAAIRLPLQFYFRGRPLRCCMWYPFMKNRAFLHRKRVIESKYVHIGPKLSGEQIDITRAAMPSIKHYWNDTWGDFIRSHWRYVQFEGHARYKDGRRFGLLLSLKKIWRITNYNLIEKNGLRGGFDGILLSFAMGCYEAGAWVSLAYHQFRLRKLQRES